MFSRISGVLALTRTVSLVAGISSATFSSTTLAQGPITFPEHVFIDFSRLPGDPPGAPSLAERTPISTQFQTQWGVSFSLIGSSDFPIVVRGDNNILSAFMGSAGPDAPLAPGGIQSGLTDPFGPDGDISTFSRIFATIDPPAINFRVFAANADGGVFPWMQVGWDGGHNRPGDSCPNGGSFRSAARNSTDLPATYFQTLLPNGVEQPLPYAITSMTIVRSPQNPLTGPFVQVSQESAPGIGDFDSSVLGVVRPRRSPVASAPLARDVYQYQGACYRNNQYAGLGWPVARAQTTFTFADMAEGLGMMVVHGSPSAESGHGTASLVTSFSGFTGLLSVPVSDDPNEIDGLDVTNRILFADSDWDNGFTDGYVVCGMNGAWEAIVDFQAFNGALESWVCASSDGLTVPLTLAVGRRVKFKAIESCIAVSSPNNTIACTGAIARLVVTGRTKQSGGAITYQWRRNGTLIDPATNPSAATATLELADFQASDNGQFDCLVTNACGSATSNSATFAICEHPADLNCDGRIEIQDLAVLLANFGRNDDPPRSQGDLDDDGSVNVQDLAILLARFGTICP